MLDFLLTAVPLAQGWGRSHILSIGQRGLSLSLNPVHWGSPGLSEADEGEMGREGKQQGGWTETDTKTLGGLSC